MPVQTNIAIQHSALLAWDGTTAFERDIRKVTQFGFTFEVANTLAADATFVVQAAPVDAADNCSPGTFADVLNPAICDRDDAMIGQVSTFTIPAGTVAGTCFGGTIACRAGAFIRLVAGGDAADVRVGMVTKGPKM